MHRAGSSGRPRAPSRCSKSSRARAATLPSSAVRTPAGTWLVLHGALLGGNGVAVFIQRAHPTLVAPLLLKAYGLTAREQEVTQWLLRGATTTQAAQRLAISPHTVNEHVKAIYDKRQAPGRAASCRRRSSSASTCHASDLRWPS